MTEPYRLHASILYQLTLTSRLQERRLDDLLRPLGLTRITWCLLLAVEVEGLHRPSDIAEFIGIDRAATSRALRQMEAEGWLGRETGRADRRTTRVQLTEAGKALLDTATPKVRANARHFLTKLPEGGEAELQSLLAALRLGEARNLLKF